MQYSNIILALVALSTSVSAFALPENTVPGTQTCEFKELKSNQSTILGWQLAGAALDDAENDATCNTTPSSPLANAGLDVDDIKAPACSASTSKINATLALPIIVAHSTSAFKSMLLNAFPPENEAPFLYLCNNIRFAKLRAFLLNDAAIISATCSKGGPDAILSPEPFTTSTEDNHTAAEVYRVTASKLFAQAYAATARSPRELKQRCDRATNAPSYQSNLEALQLDPETVSRELCSVKKVPKVPEVQAAVKSLSSELFITVVVNMSDVTGWRKWLCTELDAQAMDRVGLDGAKVKREICAMVEES